MKARVITHAAVTKDPRFPGNDPDSSRYKRRLLAEGDSWYSMGAVPVENVLLELDFPDSTIVVNIAEPGDTIVKMGDATHSKVFKRLVGDKRFAFRWNAILLSGGGNDLIDQCGDILRSGASVDGCINQTRLRACMAEIASGYRALAAVRDASAMNGECPLVVHTYDYPTPRDAPALFFGGAISGPWLITALAEKSIQEDLWIPIADRLIDTLAETILALGTGRGAIARFFPVDTRGLLTRADLGTKKKSGDWRNEIHPHKGGYKKIAAKMVDVIP